MPYVKQEPIAAVIDWEGLASDFFRRSQKASGILTGWGLCSRDSKDEVAFNQSKLIDVVTEVGR